MINLYWATGRSIFYSRPMEVWRGSSTVQSPRKILSPFLLYADQPLHYTHYNFLQDFIFKQFALKILYHVSRPRERINDSLRILQLCHVHMWKNCQIWIVRADRLADVISGNSWCLRVRPCSFGTQITNESTVYLLDDKHGWNMEHRWEYSDRKKRKKPDESLSP